MSELEPDERFVWFGFLLLAGDCAHEGLICATENSGYTDVQLADLLKADIELVRRAKRKFIKYEKISIDDNGIILILKWHLYQSEYLRQKGYRVKLQSEVTKLQSEVTNSSPSPSPSLSISISEEDSLTIKEIEKVWNDFAHQHDIPWINGITKGSARERALLARVHAPDWDLNKLLEAIAAQPFLTGDNPRGWLISFDWVLKPANLQKVMEGVYTKKIKGDRVGDNK